MSDKVIKFEFEDGRFFLNDQTGQMIAEVTYSKAGDNILILDHTFVDPILRGQGIALKLVQSVMELARKENKKIMPLCPYAKKVFDNDPSLDKIRHTHKR